VVAYSVIILPDEEYAGLCSGIRTRYANKVSKRDYFLYREHCYVYTCSKSHKILCIDKIEILDNKDLINALMKRRKK